MNQLQSNDIIDLRCDLHAIKQKFGERYFASEEAVQEAASLWGASCNKHGVLDSVTEKSGSSIRAIPPLSAFTGPEKATGMLPVTSTRRIPVLAVLRPYGTGSLSKALWRPADGQCSACWSGATSRSGLTGILPLQPSGASSKQR
ncbi:hypothetical protein [Histidinibacterium lentulum]|uniref:hypothetical protein n=1 Tax=Histidinibacterium lentulum TaxID=2480588 RepID=UPI000F4CFFFD|nr:hypothetical protein [Histidinibacterium lentulum]